MKKIISALLIATTAYVPLARAESGEFKGYVALEQILNERMLQDPSFTFLRYLNDMPGGTRYSLLILLGAISGGAEQSVFRNGEPNSVNMLLYDVLLTALARDIQTGCLASVNLDFNPAFREALDGICKWPAAEAQSQATMEKFWLALMSYDAPREEFIAWREFFVNKYATKPADQAVGDMVFAILYNPHFLLRK